MNWWNRDFQFIKGKKKKKGRKKLVF
jgi:hypothetical protein